MKEKNKKLELESETDQIKYGMINALFDQREKYIIIGLTGKVGAGCSTVAKLFQSSLEKMNLSYNQPGIRGFADENEREARILQRFYSWHQRSFYLIKVRDVIFSFLLENKDTWNEFLQRAESCQSGYKEKIENLRKEVEKKTKVDIIEYNKLLKKNSLSHSDLKLRYEYVKTYLPMLGRGIHEILGDKYTEIFQYYGNQLRFWGTTLSEKDFLQSCMDAKLEYARVRSKNMLKVNEPQEKKEREKKYLKKEAEANTIFVVAERINQFIKILQYPVKATEKNPIAVVIDSIKNIYESNYLKERYTAYYLISINRDEQLRKQQIRERKMLYSQEKLEFIDYNERPQSARKKLRAFAQIVENIYEKQCAGGEKLAYLKNIAEGNEAELLDEVLKREWKKNNKLEKVLKTGYEEQMLAFKEKGISETLYKYYCHILKEPLRVFLYVTGLHSFYLQDVEMCIQNADIFLTNNERTDEKRELCQNIVRYLCLMMHPGLVPPTSIERCMQIAYTAKINSGCISRQVGAVVTDSKYNILSLGWNDVPCGQTPCVFRNLIDVSRGLDENAYSEYEIGKDSTFKRYIQKYRFRQEIVEMRLQGLPVCYCFKDINEELTGERNPMESRSMHGEEKALLLCDQERVKGGYLFTTSSPCIMCSKNAKEHNISKIFYIEPYPGISQSHVCNSGDKGNRAQYVLFEGAIGRAYTQLYTATIPYKDELKIRGVPNELQNGEKILNNADYVKKPRKKRTEKKREKKKRYIDSGY